MGYSVYITRRDYAHDSDGPAILLSEWEVLIGSDSELRWEPELGEHFAVWREGPAASESWIAWDNGNLESKHPDAAMIRKMSTFAGLLGARLVGEEGESYDSEGSELSRPGHEAAKPVLGLWGRIRVLFRRPVAPDPGIPVGSRVRDALGRVGTVTSVDLRAEHGLGAITVRYDDGRTGSFAAMAHGLTVQDAFARGA